MLPRRLLAKKAISWLAVALGIALGFLALFGSGQAWIPDDHTSPRYLTVCLLAADLGLYALGFFIGSSIALRDRRRAGLFFLVSTPIAAFCLAFPAAVSRLAPPETDTGLLSLAVLSLDSLFFISLLAPLLVIRNRRHAASLFLISASDVGLVFGNSRWSGQLLPWLGLWSALFFVLGLFWWGTAKLGWPPLVAPRPRSLVRRLATVFVGCLLIATLDLVATLGLVLGQSSLSPFNCGRERPLFARPLSAKQAVLTAQLIRVGHTTRVSGKWAGYWAIGLVQERFWGWPPWAPPFVLITDSLFWEGETYFIDGSRANRLFPRLLPILEVGPCARTGPLVDAKIEMRVLREGAPARGVRIIGYVRKPEPFAGMFTPPNAHTPFAGAKISLTGSSGATIVITNQEGIYEVDGLPLDDYTLRLSLPDTQFARDREVKKKALVQNSMSEQDFYVVWNGSVEGTVRDIAGGPARAWVELQNPDGTSVGPSINSFLRNDKSGPYRIDKIPPGRYILTINPYGPSEDSPYAALYYPSAMRAEDAQVLDMAAGQHIKNLDFSVSPLPERKLRVRVTWPNGRPAGGAWVYIAYEHTKAYVSLEAAAEFRAADHNGLADIPVFGSSRIRVFAIQSIDEEKTGAISSRYSPPVELEADKLPSNIDLVVSLLKLPGPR